MLYDHLFIAIINNTWIRSFSNREFVGIGAAKFIIINLLLAQRTLGNFSSLVLCSIM